MGRRKHSEAAVSAANGQISGNKQHGAGHPSRRCLASRGLIEFVLRLRLGEGVAWKPLFIEKAGPGFVALTRRSSTRRAISGAMDGSPMGLRIRGTGALSVMKTVMGTSVAQCGQVSYKKGSSLVFCPHRA